MNKQSFLFTQSLLFALLALTAGCSISRSGMFENQADIGQVQVQGSITYGASSDSYTLKGGGHNIWGSEDAFFYAWNTTDSDLTLFFTRPISLVFMLLALASLLYPVYRSYREKSKAGRTQGG